MPMPTERSFEEGYLEDTKGIVKRQLSALKEESEQQEAEIFLAKAELREETSHSIANLWRADNFEQLVELSQFAAIASDHMTSYEATVKRIRQLEAQLNTPYFARIDFTFPGKGDAEKIYIGRFSLMDDRKIVIYDWRSPIAGMFYRYGLGKASYHAPAGKIEGSIGLKRQYEIRQGKLDYFFDAELEILDEFLRKLLAQNASPQMKSVVETIQRDQDIVIRDLESDLLMVQGVAGSGKTSIALHRVAYLMYSGLQNQLSSQSIAILSPNALFERYIANVLPELGEENVSSFLLDELLTMVLNRKRMQTRNQLVESVISRQTPSAALLQSSLAFKTSQAFVQILDQINLPSAKGKDAFAAYQKLFEDEEGFNQLAHGIVMPENLAQIMAFTRENLESSTLFFDDASALAYLQLKRVGFDKFRHIKQVVIDEAQDYDPIHFGIVKLMFPNARYTILGDISQTIEKRQTESFYPQVQQIFGKRKSRLLTLNKSFRCTTEILEFSRRFLDVDIQAFGRKGDAPQIHRIEEEKAFESIAQEVELCKSKGYQSIGILCKLEKDCLKLHQCLSGHMEVTLVGGETAADLKGTFLLPVYLAKGLEFDAVLLWDVDEAHYATDADRNLLYIACTRALHRLTLYHCESLSPLVAAE